MADLFTFTTDGSKAFAAAIVKGQILNFKVWPNSDPGEIPTPNTNLVNNGETFINLVQAKWDKPFIPTNKEYVISNYNGGLFWTLKDGVLSDQTMAGGAIGDGIKTWLVYDFESPKTISLAGVEGFTLFIKLENKDSLSTKISKNGAINILEEILYNKNYKKFVAPFVSNFTPDWNTTFSDFNDKRNNSLEVSDFVANTDAYGQNNKDQKYLLPANWSNNNEYPELTWTNRGSGDIIVYGFFVFMAVEDNSGNLLSYKLLWAKKLDSPTTVHYSENIKHTLKFEVIATGL
jgi:hypothetical protein